MDSKIETSKIETSNLDTNKIEKSKVEKKKKNSYEERIKAGKEFYITLLKVVLCCSIIFASGLGYLWFWLSRYERQSVNGAMTEYVKKVGAHKWSEIYQEDIENFVELNDEETYTKYLVWLYGDRNVSGMTFSFSGKDDYSSYYDVYYQQEKLCALEVRKPEGCAVWKVRTVSQNHSYTFDLLEDTTFSINNNKITDSYSHTEDNVPLAFEGLNLDDKMPSVTRYSINGFISAPVVQTSSDYITIRDYSSDHFYIGKAPTNDQITEFTQEIEDTAIAYCKYITKDGTFYALTQHLYPNTDFYYAISSFDNQWFSDHDSIEFKNTKVYDIMPIGENAFIGSISFDYVVSASDVTKTYTSAYQLFFVKNSYGNWRMSNLYILSDTSETEETN